MRAAPSSSSVLARLFALIAVPTGAATLLVLLALQVVPASTVLLLGALTWGLPALALIAAHNHCAGVARVRAATDLTETR